MANQIEISKLNSLKWYNQSEHIQDQDVNNPSYATFNPNFNFKGIDSDFFYKSLPSWMPKTRYVKPIQVGDIISNQFVGKNTTNLVYEVRLIDCDYKVFKQQTAVQRQLLPNGNRVYNFQMPMWDVPEGTYVLQIVSVVIGSTTIPQFLFMSEPFEVKELHENTSVIQYTNSYNDQNVFFDVSGGGQHFMMRVHGALVEVEPQSDFEVYSNQSNNLTMLSAKGFRNYAFQIGLGHEKVTEYECEQINLILNCDNVHIEGIKVTRRDGEQIKIERIEKSPLVYASIALQESNPMDSFIESDLHEEYIMDLPATESFFISDLSIGGSSLIPAGMSGIFLSYKRFIARLNMLQFQNANAILESYRLGYFTIRDNKVYWKSANTTAGATLHTTLSGTVTITTLLPYMLELEINTDAVNGDYFEFVLFNNVTNVRVLTFWGDGTFNSSLGIATTVTRTKTYSSYGKFIARIFSNEVISYDMSASDFIVNAIGGNLSAKTEIVEADAIGLQKLSNNIFTKVEPSKVNLFYAPFNKMTTSSVSEALIYMYDSRKCFDPTGTISLESQTPAAPPNNDIVYLRSEILAQVLTD